MIVPILIVLAVVFFVLGVLGVIGLVLGLAIAFGCVLLAFLFGGPWAGRVGRL
jgi:hypothetical protein